MRTGFGKFGIGLVKLGPRLDFERFRKAITEDKRTGWVKMRICMVYRKPMIDPYLMR